MRSARRSFAKVEAALPVARTDDAAALCDPTAAALCELGLFLIKAMP